MPWFESKPVSGKWGWHWTMNHFEPPKLASRYHPLMGLYDSSDPDALECQTLLMKIAGIDGVLIDWYGTKDLYDYSIINRNTGKMIDACAARGLKFGIVIEDQVVSALVKNGKSTPDEYARSAMDWLKTNWFSKPGYLRWSGQPALLMFGPQYYKEPDLTALFGGCALFTLLGKKGPAVGAFGWPEPQVGNEKSWTQVQGFYDRAKDWKAAIGIAYPRFEDIYKEAGVGAGYGEILDQDGKTFRQTLKLAEDSHVPFIQLATWNDWGEGTQIEPSEEFGYRDLEELQRTRQSSDPRFSYSAQDLKLPIRLYRLRKKGASAVKLERVAKEILNGHCDQARTDLSALGG